MERSHLAMNDCFILNGSAEFGGGIFAYQGFADFNNLVIFNNKTSSSVGGIELWGLIYDDGKPSIFKNSHIVNNSGSSTGGLFVHGGSAILDNLIVKYNFSSDACGGIRLEDDHSILSNEFYLTNSTIEENTGYTCGGLYCNNFKPNSEDIITNLIRNNVSVKGDNPNFQQRLSG